MYIERESEREIYTLQYDHYNIKPTMHKYEHVISCSMMSNNNNITYHNMFKHTMV